VLGFPGNRKQVVDLQDIVAILGLTFTQLRMHRTISIIGSECHTPVTEVVIYSQ